MSEVNDVKTVETTDSESVLTRANGSILEITLNRPHKKNALNKEMYIRLAKAIDSVADDDRIRVVLLKGAKECFTSGNDLEDFANAASSVAEVNPILKFMTALTNCPKPVVAAVDGFAVGIGTTLLLHCDLVYASPRSTFKLPFVNLGLCAEYASSYLLPRLAGYVKAAEWLLLGEEFSALDALEFGLINSLADDPYELALIQSQKLASQPPAAVRNTKALLKNTCRKEVQESIMEESQLFGESLGGEEFAEAVTAFFEKRQPDFSKFK